MSSLEPVNRLSSKSACARGSLWPAQVFVLLLCAGFGVTVQSLRNVPAASWAGMTEPAKLLGGEATRRFTSNLNAHFLLSHFFAQVERAVTWTLVGDTGAAVRTGCSGWFFLSEELETFAHAQQSAQARAAIVAAVSQQLKAKGIALVVALVPDKSRIEQAQLCGLHRAPAFAPRLGQWQAALQTAGVDVINLEPVLAAMQEPRYYRTDSHWNEAGAHAAAKTIVQHLFERQLQALPEPLPNAASLHRDTVERPGDLLRFSNLEGWPMWLRPVSEQAQVTRFEAAAAPAVAADDLFGDAGLPKVVVLGTSFARTSNFVPFMGFELGAVVANLAKDGGNFEGAALDYLASDTLAQTPPTVVVWEVPERMLQKPLSPAEYQWLRDLKLLPVH